VIRIELPAGPGEDLGGARHGFDFQNLHRNKRAINLNLKDPDGHAAFGRLVKPPTSWSKICGPRSSTA
jgi:crotonobetainyl-CoA:carnitine CoA-transferase CaiB-like acyl-CoA transferase